MELTKEILDKYNTFVPKLLQLVFSIHNIDKEQNHLKKKYKVEKVYAPDTLDVKKEITYNENLSTVKELKSILEAKCSLYLSPYKSIL